MIRKGIYQTVDGLKAIVSTLRSIDGNHWRYFGAVEYDGVLYIHIWHTDGRSCIQPAADLRLE